MKYKITITKIEEVTTTRRGEYTVIDKVPWKADDLGNKHAYESEREFLKLNPLREVRGYAPDSVTKESVTTEVYSQTCENLDLGAVIVAVNGLNK